MSDDLLDEATRLADEARHHGRWIEEAVLRSLVGRVEMLSDVYRAATSPTPDQAQDARIRLSLLSLIGSRTEARAAQVVREASRDYPLPDVRDALWALLESGAVLRESDGTLRRRSEGHSTVEAVARLLHARYESGASQVTLPDSSWEDFVPDAKAVVELLGEGS